MDILYSNCESEVDKDRRCTCIIALGRFNALLLAAENNKD